MSKAGDSIRDRRRVWAAPGGAHDRKVHLLSRWLPGAVGVVAALMILGPLWPRGEISFLLDRNKVAVTGDRLRVSGAMYRGLDKSGQPFTITAGSAVQASAARPEVQMNALVARIRLASGPAQLTADGGTYNYVTERVAVPGAVQFSAADGYRLTTGNVAIDLANRRVSGSGGVSGAIPAGTFSAERISADLDERTITLDGHARLRMEPGHKLGMP